MPTAATTFTSETAIGPSVAKLIRLDEIIKTAACDNAITTRPDIYFEAGYRINDLINTISECDLRFKFYENRPSVKIDSLGGPVFYGTHTWKTTYYEGYIVKAPLSSVGFSRNRFMVIGSADISWYADSNRETTLGSLRNQLIDVNGFTRSGGKFTLILRKYGEPNKQWRWNVESTDEQIKVKNALDAYMLARKSKIRISGDTRACIGRSADDNRLRSYPECSMITYSTMKPIMTGDISLIEYVPPSQMSMDPTDILPEHHRTKYYPFSCIEINTERVLLCIARDVDPQSVFYGEYSYSLPHVPAPMFFLRKVQSNIWKGVEMIPVESGMFYASADSSSSSFDELFRNELKLPPNLSCKTTSEDYAHICGGVEPVACKPDGGPPTFGNGFEANSKWTSYKTKLLNAVQLEMGIDKCATLKKLRVKLHPDRVPIIVREALSESDNEVSEVLLNQIKEDVLELSKGFNAQYDLYCKK